MEDTIGIDISKDKLDAYWLSKGEHKQFCNDKAGVKALALWANEAGVSRVIFESTGIYHRCVETGLADHDISFCAGKPTPGTALLRRGWPAGKNRPGRRCNAGPNGVAVAAEGG